MNENGNPMVMPVAPYYGGNNDGMFGGVGRSLTPSFSI